MYTIKRASELTGVSVATLRAWERRYGFVTPRRTDSRYRLYDEASLRTIVLMRDLVAAGWSPRQAAAEAQRRGSADTTTTTGDTTDTTGDTVNTTTSDITDTTGNVTNTVTDTTAVAGGAPPKPVGAPSADRPIAGPLADPIDGPIDGPIAEPVAELVSAAADLDAGRLSQLLDDRLSRGSFEAVVHRWLMPAMQEIGNAWADGRIGVAAEHLVTAAVQRRLAAAYEAAARPLVGTHVLVGLPPGVRHELGILAFATAARRVGLAVTYLGADLPSEDWASAVRHHDARCVVLSLPRAEDLDGLVSVIEAVRRSRPRTQIYVGGRFQHLAPAPAHPLGHNIGVAATHLANHLAAHAPAQPPPVSGGDR